MYKINLLQASFDEIDAATEKSTIVFTDDYMKYTVTQLETFVKNLGYLLDDMESLKGDNESDCNNLSSYLFELYWGYTHEINEGSNLFKLVESHFINCIDLAATVLKEGPAYA